MTDSIGVVSINHGNVFGTGSWYTFHCPTCSAQVTGRQDFCKCGERLKWPPIKQN